MFRTLAEIAPDACLEEFYDIAYCHFYSIGFVILVYNKKVLKIYKKEDSVPISRVLSRGSLSTDAVPAIYPVHESPHVSSIPPSVGVSRTGNPQTTVYANLQPPDDTAR